VSSRFAGIRENIPELAVVLIKLTRREFDAAFWHDLLRGAGRRLGLRRLDLKFGPLSLQQSDFYRDDH